MISKVNQTKYAGARKEPVFNKVLQITKGFLTSVLLGFIVGLIASLGQTLLFWPFLDPQLHQAWKTFLVVLWYFGAFCVFIALLIGSLWLVRESAIKTNGHSVLVTLSTFAVVCLLGLLILGISENRQASILHSFWSVSIVVFFSVATILCAFTFVDKEKKNSKAGDLFESLRNSSVPEYSEMKSTRRKLIVIIDGTNDFASTTETHPFLLSQELMKSKVSSLLVYYDGGVGTLRQGSRNSKIAYLLSFVDMALGQSLLRNVASAYEFLVDNYRGPEQDEILMFGFSRGAFAVRVLSGVLFVYGLVEKQHKNLIPFIVQRVGSPKENTDKELIEAFRSGTATMLKIPVHYMGLWDTVDSVGFFRQQSFPFTARLPNVNQLRHAVAKDECRNMFSEVLILKGKNANPNHLEMWFKGVHRDVGGGDEQTEKLSLCAYNWVIEPIQNDLGITKVKGQDYDSDTGLAKSWRTTFVFGFLGIVPQRKYSAEFEPKGYRWHYFNWTHERNLPMGAREYSSYLDNHSEKPEGPDKEKPI